MAHLTEKEQFFEFMGGTEKRAFHKTHPWITFAVNLERCPAPLWLALGEAHSKCQHLAGVPLKPAIANKLHQLYLAKGAHATTAIEGNTLSEEQVLKRVQGERVVPRSQHYLEQEIDNVVALSNDIMKAVETDGPQPITPADLRRYNSQILKGLDVDDHVVPGEYRRADVGVMDYKAPNAEDCEFLMATLCSWLNSGFEAPREDQSIIYGILKAVVAHLYLAWIHAFGDGNGRTARAAEVRFLMEAGVPSSAIHLLSNHYNYTRSEYYRQLSIASKNGGNINQFLVYSIEGLVDQLREQLKVVKSFQWKVAWENWIYERFGQDKTVAEKRQIKLLLALSEKGDAIPRAELRRLTPELAEEYAGKTSKTLSRDLNRLQQEGFINVTRNSVRANRELILAFLPRMRKGGWEAQMLATSETKLEELLRG